MAFRLQFDRFMQANQSRLSHCSLSLVIAFLGLTAHLGCSTSVRHGPAPQLPQAPSTARCVADRGMVLVESEATLRGLNRNPGTIRTHNIGGTTYSQFVVNPNSSASTTWVSGLTPYVGARRLRPAEAVSVLEDRELEESYERSFEPYAAGKWRAMRPVWIGLLAGASALLVAGAVTGNQASIDPDTGVTDFGNTFVYLGGSIAGYLASIPLLYLDLTNHDKANQLEVREEIFVLDRELQRSLATALVRHNRSVARACAARAAGR